MNHQMHLLGILPVKNNFNINFFKRSVNQSLHVDTPESENKNVYFSFLISVSLVYFRVVNLNSISQIISSLRNSPEIQKLIGLSDSLFMNTLIQNKTVLEIETFYNENNKSHFQELIAQYFDLTMVDKENSTTQTNDSSLLHAILNGNRKSIETEELKYEGFADVSRSKKKKEEGDKGFNFK